jgi:WD40 repeat protein
METQSQDPVTITTLGFNQDYQCFQIGTTTGFHIYNSDPQRERFSRLIGHVELIEILYKTNIIVFVGGKYNDKYPPNKVIIWDDQEAKVLAGVAFSSDVRGLRIRRDRIIVATETKVYVYKFDDITLKQIFDTCPNPRGLIAMSQSDDSVVLVHPSNKTGVIKINIYDYLNNPFHCSGSNEIHAHHNELSQIAINIDGTKVATASERGTLIRVFDVKLLQLLHEFRRGYDPADIYSIAFSWNPYELLAVTSNKGTLHIFNMNGDKRQLGWTLMKGTRGVAKSSPPGLLNYDYINPWDDRWIVGFMKQKQNITNDNYDPVLIVVSSTGRYYRYLYNPKEEELYLQTDIETIFFSPTNIKIPPNVITLDKKSP